MRFDKGISVIICCYNSSKRLPETLKHLANQIVTDTLNWEIIIVNNASTDDTTSVAKSEWSRYKTDIPLLVTDQPIPGQSAAREKGYQIARYEYLLYVDDDNWLKSDYLANVYHIMNQNPQIGILGGQCNAAFETKPPDWFSEKQSIYAVGKQGIQNGPLTSKKKYLYGAASVIRKSALENLHQRQFRFLTKGRTGTQLAAGDDVELNKAIRMLGYVLWYDESLQFTHFMSSGRLNWDYLIRIGKGSASSSLALMVYDFFLENKQLSFSKFSKLYLVAVFKRVFTILRQIRPFFRSFTLHKREGDLAAFDAMRSRIFLKRLLTSFGEASAYFRQIKKIQSNIHIQNHSAELFPQ